MKIVFNGCLGLVPLIFLNKWEIWIWRMVITKRWSFIYELNLKIIKITRGSILVRFLSSKKMRNTKERKKEEGTEKWRKKDTYICQSFITKSTQTAHWMLYSFENIRGSPPDPTLKPLLLLKSLDPPMFYWNIRIGLAKNNVGYLVHPEFFRSFSQFSQCLHSTLFNEYKDRTSRPPFVVNDRFGKKHYTLVINIEGTLRNAQNALDWNDRRGACGAIIVKAQGTSSSDRHPRDGPLRWYMSFPA